MSYRVDIDERPKEKRRTAQATVTPAKVFLVNGARSVIAFPCYYFTPRPLTKPHIHSVDHHDHVGWPSPNHPDHSCQEPIFHVKHGRQKGYMSTGGYYMPGHKVVQPHEHYLDMSRLDPIHLKKEGYKNVQVKVHDWPEGLNAWGSIDAQDDWVVRVTFDANIPYLQKHKDKLHPEHNDEYIFPFAVTVDNASESTEATRRDVVVNGIVVVQYSPIDDIFLA
jgi:hypothetical protein